MPEKILCAETARRCVAKVNIPRLIAQQLVGSTHKPVHHFGVGAVFMVVGVTVAGAGSAIPWPGGHVLADIFGWSLHALGMTPVIEHVLALVAEDA